MKFSPIKVHYRLPPPRVGEHTEEVLLGEGFTQDEIAVLHAEGAIDNAKFDIPSPDITVANKKDRKPSLKVSGRTFGDIRSLSVFKNVNIMPPKKGSASLDARGMADQKRHWSSSRAVAGKSVTTSAAAIQALGSGSRSFSFTKVLETEIMNSRFGPHRMSPG